MFEPRSRARALTGAIVAATLLTTVALPAFAADIGPPTGIRVARDASTPTTLDLGWKPPAGADHVRVSVFDGTTDHVRTMSPDLTSLEHVGSGECTRYRVRFAAVAPDGTSAKAGTVLVNSLAPGGLRSITGERQDEGRRGVISWTGPSWWGEGTDPAYRVTVKESSTGRELANEMTTGTSITVPGLDKARQYVAKVTATNSFGGCFTSSHVLRAGRPSPPYGLVATRDEVPSTIHLTWRKPTWEGYGSITHYRVYYGDSWVNKEMDVTAREVTIQGFKPEKDSKFQVVAYDGELRGQPSASHSLARLGAAGKKELDPRIRIQENGGVIDVDIAGPVGSNTTFPELFLDIDSATPTTTYSTRHRIANRADALTFDRVPCGVFTVTVTGQGLNEGREFGRVLVNQCNVGGIEKSMWRLVYGRATMDDNVVDMPNGSETRVLSRKPMVSQDMALTTKAKLHAGSGYGIWLRAHLPVNANNASVSGYTMQYDPGYGRLNSFGPALLLRVWDTGRECATPLARVKWPEGLDVYAKHEVSAVVQGDAMYMSIAGNRLFAVASLTDAMETSGCAAAGFQEPSGNQIGFRIWGQGTRATFEGTTLN